MLKHTSKFIVIFTMLGGLNAFAQTAAVEEDPTAVETRGGHTAKDEGKAKDDILNGKAPGSIKESNDSATKQAERDQAVKDKYDKSISASVAHNAKEVSMLDGKSLSSDSMTALTQLTAAGRLAGNIYNVDSPKDMHGLAVLASKNPEGARILARNISSNVNNAHKYPEAFKDLVRDTTNVLIAESSLGSKLSQSDSIIQEGAFTEFFSNYSADALKTLKIIRAEYAQMVREGQLPGRATLKEAAIVKIMEMTGESRDQAEKTAESFIEKRCLLG